MNDQLDISHIANLSRLDLSKEEKDKYAKQMGDILGYVEQIDEAKTKDDVEVGIANGVTDVMREDEVGESLSREQALKNSPAQKDGFIQVKAVFNQED